jgi:hypothetical protein
MSPRASTPDPGPSQIVKAHRKAWLTPLIPFSGLLMVFCRAVECGLISPPVGGEGGALGPHRLALVVRR